MKQGFILFVNVLYSMIVFCQPSVVRVESKLIQRSDFPQNTIGYIVRNSTTDTLYIWIQKEQEISHSKDSFKKYFFSRLGDFSLAMLCFDGNIVCKDEFIPVLGHNFIKRLCPNELFYIYSLICEMDVSVIHWESIKAIRKMVSPQKLDKYNCVYDYIIIDTLDF